MKDTIAVGLKHQATLIVDDTLTVPNVSTKLEAFSDMPPVFATAFMVGFIEATCIEAIAPYLDEGEHSVGVTVNVNHIAATPTGMNVTAEVELAVLEGRVLLFNVLAKDDEGLIGEGVHKRAIINVEKFMARVAQKAAQS